jgi:hypothetical protein
VNILGEISKPLSVKYFVAIMYQTEFPIESLLLRLDTKFGKRETVYGPIDFSWSEYYASEMGDNLKKMYICYEALEDRDALPSIKIFTNAIEEEYAVDKKRVVNIDPGYIARDKVVLATTKDFYHRLYLHDGIFGEVTLHYKRGQYRFFSWTYPDYRQKEVYALFEKARSSLVKHLRNGDDE